MKLHSLRIENFAAIGNVDLEFGPGLNVLYGRNDLGKSTVVTAIRLGLLLPHTSTHSDQYIGWTGSDSPVVEMTFETEAQRIWRIRKQFGKSGFSLLQESRNGQDFDDVERGRRVDAKVREILRWGISEPGGMGGGKGLPASFLTTALLSPQEDVSGVLYHSLQNDPTGSGKELIAAALQAAAQDPLFVLLLRETQARRDAAYTDKGAKKTAIGSVFKLAAERLNETRNEKEKLQRIVADSEGAERQLRELMDLREQKEEEWAIAAGCLANFERLSWQAGCRSAAADQVRQAQEEVERIQRIRTEADAAERQVAELFHKIFEAEDALVQAVDRQAEAEEAFKVAEDASRAEGDPGMADTIVRQQIESRRLVTDQVARESQQRINSALSAQKIIEIEAAKRHELHEQEAKGEKTLRSASKATADAKAADDKLRRCDLLERALDVHTADQEVKNAQAAVENEAALRARFETASSERAVLAQHRSVITVPVAAALGPMRKQARELDAARSALDVGFVVTVSPKDPLNLQVRSDGKEVDSISITQPLDIEADAEIEISIADLAVVRVRGGRREAQEKVKLLENQWDREVAPHLVAASVRDLDGLEAKIVQAQDLDTGIKKKDAEMETLRSQIAALAGAAETLRKATDRLGARRASLGEVGLETLADDIKALGADVTAGLRKRRQDLSKEAAEARRLATEAVNDLTRAEERTKHLRLALDSLGGSRNTALMAFPEGVDSALDVARTALAAAVAENASLTAAFASLELTIKERKNRLDAALNEARTNLARARMAVETGQGRLTMAKTSHASDHGRLIELRKQRDAQNLTAAEIRLREANERFLGFPVPERLVTETEVSAARAAAASLKFDLDRIERNIDRAHGALEQVGGAVARERLRDAIEAFELAERQEREIEAEYEAWRLLLDQMKEADAAQASNLGQVIVPAIAGRFQELTHRRYESVQLTAELEMKGIVVSGTPRQPAQLSVGTREQLSALYRLALAEFLRTVIVLDDQLVQSDDQRMDWFRALLTEKARHFQIIVLTCRPSDYLLAGAMVPPGSEVRADTDGGFLRAVDLERVLRRR